MLRLEMLEVDSYTEWIDAWDDGYLIYVILFTAYHD